MRKHETIEDIAAELRVAFNGDNASMYFLELSNRIVAAHIEGVLRAINEIKTEQSESFRLGNK